MRFSVKQTASNVPKYRTILRPLFCKINNTGKTRFLLLHILQHSCRFCASCCKGYWSFLPFYTKNKRRGS